MVAAPALVARRSTKCSKASEHANSTALAHTSVESPTPKVSNRNAFQCGESGPLNHAMSRWSHSPSLMRHGT